MKAFFCYRGEGTGLIKRRIPYQKQILTWIKEKVGCNQHKSTHFDSCSTDTISKNEYHTLSDKHYWIGVALREKTLSLENTANFLINSYASNGI